VDLEVNGRKVELNAFVQGMIAETVKGMVGALRGVGDIETVSLKIKRISK
jgi:hypothetical protein